MKVLLGFDDETSVDVLERTIERATAAGDDLTVAIVEADADTSRQQLEATVESAVSETELSIDIRHVEGTPGSRLVDIAESEGFDEIVLGGNTTSPMGKINIDQTAEFVLLNSHVTVTLVR